MLGIVSLFPCMICLQFLVVLFLSPSVSHDILHDGYVAAKVAVSFHLQCHACHTL